LQGFSPRISKKKNNILFLFLHELDPRMMWNIKYLIGVSVTLAQANNNLKKIKNLETKSWKSENIH